MKKFLCLAVFAAFAISACATAPMTGRRQLSLIPASEINAMSATAFSDVKRSSRIITTGANAEMIRTVGRNIAAAAEQYLRDHGRAAEIANYSWEFILIDDATVNAWAMPGGRIAFYTGILPLTQNVNGVAVVMAHEVAHVIAGHSAERMSQAMLANMGGSILGQATRNQSQMVQTLSQTGYGIAANLGILLPFSRRQEYEADKIGLMLMAMAGYDPAHAVTFWQRMSALSAGGSTSDFMSTHPSDANRIAAIQRNLPAAQEVYRNRRR
ncbi:MAG: M48 family metallopeptidase [Elusimicrobia bacterium]|nr:M48 family metallopeptidase [Elusimicrobiota bacterium]